MLPKSSPKWLQENGEWDALTPFGVRILKPEVGAWREVRERRRDIFTLVRIAEKKGSTRESRGT